MSLIIITNKSLYRITLFTGCVMDNMAIDGDDYQNYTNIGNHLDCKRKCIDDKECYTWTYKDGKCYLKNENTFKGHHGDNVLSGMKDCNSTGIKIIYYKRKLLTNRLVRVGLEFSYIKC